MAQPLSLSNSAPASQSLRIPSCHTHKAFILLKHWHLLSQQGFFFVSTDRQHQTIETMCRPAEDGGTYHPFETPLCLPYSAVPWMLARYTDTLIPFPSDYGQSSLSRSPCVPGALSAHPNSRCKYTSKYKFQVYYHALASTIQPHHSSSAWYRPDSTTHEPYLLCRKKKKRMTDAVQLSFLVVNSWRHYFARCHGTKFHNK